MYEINLEYQYVMNDVEIKRERLSERYKKDEKILNEYINKEKYLSADINYVYFISTLINSFYSTRMGGDRLFEVAKFISEYQNIKTTGKVIEIIEVATTKKFKLDDSNNSYSANSFLSKYYALHNRIAFHYGEYSEIVILDTKVKQAIKQIIHSVKDKNKRYKLYSNEFLQSMKKYKCKDCDDYRKLSEMVSIICDEINLTKPQDKELATFTTVDNYFWGL